MPSGPKKRKAARRRREALRDHLCGPSSASIPSPGQGRESGDEMASQVIPERWELETAEGKMESCGLSEVDQAVGDTGSGGDGDGDGEKDSVVQGADEVADAIEEMENDKDGYYIVDHGAAGAGGVKKSVHVAEPSCVIERPVSLIEEIKSSEVPIEKIAEPLPVAVQTSEVGGVEAKEHEKVLLSLSGTCCVNQPQPGCAEDPSHVADREFGSVVANRTSWMSCCGLFDAFVGCNR